MPLHGIARAVVPKRGSPANKEWPAVLAGPPDRQARPRTPKNPSSASTTTMMRMSSRMLKTHLLVAGGVSEPGGPQTGRLGESRGLLVRHVGRLDRVELRVVLLQPGISLGFHLRLMWSRLVLVPVVELLDDVEAGRDVADRRE